MELTQETTKARLAELLKRVRKAQHMTQVQVAKRFQVSQPAVAQWETGATTPPAHVVIWLVEMSAALGIGTPQ